MEPARSADDVRGDIEALRIIVDSLLDTGIEPDNTTLLALERVLADRKAELDALEGCVPLSD